MVYFLIKNYQKNGQDEIRLGTTGLKCSVKMITGHP